MIHMIHTYLLYDLWAWNFCTRYDTYNVLYYTDNYDLKFKLYHLF